MNTSGGQKYFNQKPDYGNLFLTLPFICFLFSVGALRFGVIVACLLKCRCSLFLILSLFLSIFSFLYFNLMLGLASHCYDYGDDYYNSCFCGLGSFWIEFCSEASFDKIILTFSEKKKLSINFFMPIP